MLVVIAVAFATSGDTLEAVVFALIAPLFVPAVVVSAVDSPRRNAILRASTALCLLIAIGGAFVDYGIPVVMSLPTFCLALAAGLIFQSR
jgi:hypothetical protein